MLSVSLHEAGHCEHKITWFFKFHYVLIVLWGGLKIHPILFSIGKLELASQKFILTYQSKEKSQKPSKLLVFWNTTILGGFWYQQK